MIYSKNILTVPNATPETKDAAQYMLRKGVRQYNLCGEFCVAYCVGETNIDSFLDKWEAQDLKWYQQVFKNGLGRTTGIYDLEKMLKVYNVPTPCERLKSLDVIEKLKTHRLIVGVQIDRLGYLVGKGIPHWVVLDGLEIIDELHAICQIYNPYTNAVEPYSWREFLTSTGVYKQGIWIERV